jgi:hypothetical protein
VLPWAADTAVGWKGCTKKLSAIRSQLSVGSKAPLARAGPFCCVPSRVENHLAIGLLDCEFSSSTR